MRILLAEDDELLGSGLRVGLGQRGFQVDWVRDGVATEHELLGAQHQAVVLDIGLPRQDGLAVLKAIRARGIDTPVLVLTARDAVVQRIEGLNRGADDYVVKPVDLDELAARLHALVRRAHGKTQTTLQLRDVVMNPGARQVSRGGEAISLSTREFDLLQALLLNEGRVLSREQLEQYLYRWGHEVESNTIEVHIHHLRRKMGAGLIVTVRGVGYIITR
ncbi:MAG: winged helix-turn-helix domain-containing protein [Rhodoferax sp.]|nr:winged helix-turn-helix domain-containing protein [Rhodoferax sp.]